MRSGEGTNSTSDFGERRSARVEELISQYVDRLVNGDTVDFDDIIIEHPDVGEEVVDYLTSFIDVREDTDEAPLGTLGDYTLRRQIGRGGMGVVYEAWENSMDRAVALKVLPGAVAADEKALQRFVREAKVAGDLRHPNVVPVFGMGLKENTPYYSMEFVEGETLAQITARTKGDDEEAETPFGKKGEQHFYLKLARSFADVADGLQHAHSKGVTHRDIKPSNLILDRDGRLRILDFGLARLEGQESLTLSGDFVGTPLYMSPEQAGRKRISIDHRSDVYSLGATMYQSICGRPPFRGKDHADTLSQIIERDPVEPRKVNPRVPRDLETVVLKCLRKKADDRYGTAEALGQDLRRFARGDPIEARPCGSWERWSRRVARHRIRFGMGFLIAFLIVSMTLLVSTIQSKQRAIDLAHYRDVVRDGVKTFYLERYTGHLPRGGGVFNRKNSKQFLVRGTTLESNATRRIEEAVGQLERAAGAFPTLPDACYLKARGLLLLDDVEAASRELRRLIETTPDFVPAYTLLAKIHRNLDEFDVAAVLVDKARRIDRDWVDAWSRTEVSSAAGDWHARARAIGDLVALERTRGSTYVGEREDLLLSRGVARFEARDYQGAIRDFASVQHMWRNAAGPALLLGQTYVKMGSPDTAQAWFEEWFDRSRVDPTLRSWFLYSIACVFGSHPDARTRAMEADWIHRMRPSLARERILLWRLAKTRPEGALSVYEKARTEYGEDPICIAIMGVALSFLGRDEDAATAAERALKIDSESSPIRFLCAHVFSMVGHLERTEQLHRAVAQDDPEFYSAFLNLGYILLRRGKYAEAVEVLERRIADNPLDAMALLKLAWACRATADFDRALELARRVAEMDLGFFQSEAYLLLSAILRDFGRHREASEVIQRGLDEIPNDRFLSLVRADTALDEGKLDEALDLYSTTLSLRPTHPSYRNWYRRAFANVCTILRRGYATDFSGLVELRDSIAAYGDLYPRAPHYFDVLALLHARTGVAGARDWLSESRRHRSTESARYLANFAEVERLEGGMLRGIVLLERAIRRPDARTDMLFQLEAFRESALPRVASLKSLDTLVSRVDHGSDAELAIRHEILGENGAAYPAAFRAYLNGLLLRREGKLASAVRAFRQAASLEPEDLVPTLSVVKTLRAQKLHREEEDFLRKALKVQSDKVELWQEWLFTATELLKLDADAARRILPDVDSEERHHVLWVLEHVVAGAPLKINCGAVGNKAAVPSGDAVGDWVDDRFSTGGQPVREFAGIIASSEGLDVYRTARRFAADRIHRGYRIPVPNGRYDVTLHFAEVVSRTPEKRMFDVVVEARTLGVDIELSEYAHALRRGFEVWVHDAALDLEFEAGKDDPIISGVEILRLK